MPGGNPYFALDGREIGSDLKFGGTKKNHLAAANCTLNMVHGAASRLRSAQGAPHNSVLNADGRNE